MYARSYLVVVPRCHDNDDGQLRERVDGIVDAPRLSIVSKVEMKTGNRWMALN
jgi:hypothetical protein